MERKETKYRYPQEIAKIFQLGFELYKHEKPTKIFSLNQLIDICIKKAVIELPKIIQHQSEIIKQLEKKINKEQIEKQAILDNHNKVWNLILQKKEIENELQLLITQK